MRTQIIQDDHAGFHPADRHFADFLRTARSTDQGCQRLDQRLVVQIGLAADVRNRLVGRLPLRDQRIVVEHQMQDVDAEIDRGLRLTELRLLAALQYLHHRLQARNVPEQRLRHLGRTVRQRALIARQTLAVEQFLDQFHRQRDVADLREHGRRLELPEALRADRGRDLHRQALDPVGAAEGDGIGDGEHVDQRLDAADQRFLQQHLLRHHEPVVRNPRLDGRTQRIRRTGLGQKSEYLAVVDRRDCRLAARLAGQQDARHVGNRFPDPLQQGRAVHDGHAHVADDHRGSRHLLQHVERDLAAVCGEDLVVAAQVQRQALENPRLVIHTQDPG